MMRYLLFLLSVLLWIGARAQSTEKEEIIQTRIEFLSEQLESEEIDLTDVVAQLNYFYDHPLNLNSVSAEQLRELALLTEVQIADLLLHRKLFGKFISIYEIQCLQFWDMQSISMVLPFVRVDDKLDQVHMDLKEIIKNATFESFLRYQRILEEKSGYQDVPDSVLSASNQYYHGNPDRYYARFRYSYLSNFSVGFTMEKDPGEAFFRGAQKEGFDFYSGHLFAKGGKYLRAVAVGDYQVQIGQGLNLWSGYAFRKTADVVNVKRSAIPLKPYTSVDETRFMRGAAVDLGYKNWSLLTFVSRKGIDGSLVADTLNKDEEYASSINLSGFHRTNSEIEKKNSLVEYLAGANLRYTSRAFSFGVAAIHQSYDKPLVRDTALYNQFAFRGKETTNLSADYSFVHRNVNLFGELSYAGFNQRFALVQGLLIALDRRVSLALIYRSYDRCYHSFYTAGFAETANTSNEQGLYSGLRISLSKSIEIQSYADLFRFPWLRYRVNAPSQGYEYLIQPTYRPNKSVEVYLRYREQRKAINSDLTDGSIRQLVDAVQRNYRINLSLKVTESIRIKSRAEMVTIDRIDRDQSVGIILTQDLLWNPKDLPFDITLRYAFFDTDSYDSRIYTYENNALYTFSIPAYYYQGSRFYVLLRYRFLRVCDLWVRYGRTLYNNRESVGSGSEMTNGPSRTDLTVQLRIKF